MQSNVSIDSQNSQNYQLSVRFDVNSHFGSAGWFLCRDVWIELMMEGKRTA